MSAFGHADLSKSDTWIGGYYEAEFVLGAFSDRESDSRIRKALAAVWSLPASDMCVSGRLEGPEKQDKIELLSAPLESIRRIYGRYQIEHIGFVPFTTVVSRECGWGSGYHRLFAAIPMGGLAEIIPSVGAYPAGDLEGSRSWREPIERGLANIALAVAREVPFLVAAIGHEPVGCWIGLDAALSRGEFPYSRDFGYVWPNNGVYQYFPTTDWTT